MIVKPNKAETTTKSGLIVSDSVMNKRYVEATVVAVGPGNQSADGTYIPLDVTIGAVVLYPINANAINIEDVGTIIFAHDVIAVKN